MGTATAHCKDAHLVLYRDNFTDLRQVYLSGNAVVILKDSTTILQTIYDDDSSNLIAVSIDEASGKIAACTESTVRIYQPYGQNEGALKARGESSQYSGMR